MTALVVMAAGLLLCTWVLIHLLGEGVLDWRVAVLLAMIVLQLAVVQLLRRR